MRGLVRIVLLVASVGCSQGPRPQEGASAPPQTITEAEIASSQATTAYDAVMRLRANFFSDRGKTTILGSSPSVPNVYLDGVPYGPLASLRNIPAGQVSSIRLYRAWEASSKFGASNMAGVIEVLTKH